MIDVRDGLPRHDQRSVTRGWYSYAARFRGEGTEARRAWRGAYVRRIILGDIVCAALAGFAGYLVRFGSQTTAAHASTWAAVALPVIWVGAMLVARSYEERFLWVGAEEFRRVFFAAMMLLAALGTVSWAFQLDVARGFVILAVPLATLLTFAHRYLQRRLLHHARRRGQHLQTTLLVGHRNAVAALDEQLDREAYHGYRVVGCCLPTDQFSPNADAFNGLPVLGGIEEVADVVSRYEVDTVAVLPCPELDGPALRRLGWDLEKTRAELLLAPAITEIVGTRVRIRPVCGLPLMHMERPELTGVRRLGKDVFDKASATLGVLFLLPVLLGIALAIKLTSKGPVFFRQERVGRDGQIFKMLKFRSMVPGADRMVEALAQESDGNGVLFKKKDDPRITNVGKFIRRYSLDELPQLINVIRGDM